MILLNELLHNIYGSGLDAITHADIDKTFEFGIYFPSGAGGNFLAFAYSDTSTTPDSSNEYFAGLENVASVPGSGENIFEPWTDKSTLASLQHDIDLDYDLYKTDHSIVLFHHIPVSLCTSNVNIEHLFYIHCDNDAERALAQILYEMKTLFKNKYTRREFRRIFHVLGKCSNVSEIHISHLMILVNEIFPYYKHDLIKDQPPYIVFEYIKWAIDHNYNMNDRNNVLLFKKFTAKQFELKQEQYPNLYGPVEADTFQHLCNTGRIKNVTSVSFFDLMLDLKHAELFGIDKVYAYSMANLNLVEDIQSALDMDTTTIKEYKQRLENAKTKTS